MVLALMLVIRTLMPILHLMLSMTGSFPYAHCNYERDFTERLFIHENKILGSLPPQTVAHDLPTYHWLRPYLYQVLKHVCQDDVSWRRFRSIIKSCTTLLPSINHRPHQLRRATPLQHGAIGSPGLLDDCSRVPPRLCLLHLRHILREPHREWYARVQRQYYSSASKTIGLVRW